MNGEGSRGAATYWVPALFSEKKRSTKSPSLLGSKVDGTTTYSPGGRRNRVLTSRRLMNCSERARDELARKKSLFKCTGRPTSWEDRALQGCRLAPAPTPKPQGLYYRHPLANVAPDQPLPGTQHRSGSAHLQMRALRLGGGAPQEGQPWAGPVWVCGQCRGQRSGVSPGHTWQALISEGRSPIHGGPGE